MRKRIRTNYGMTVYRFWAKPIGEIPIALWAQAKAMQALWNQLVELRAACLVEAATLEGEKKKARFARLDVDIKAAVYAQNVKALLNFPSREWVYEKFKTAARAAAKKKATLSARTRLENITIPFRYGAQRERPGAGGGLTIEEFFGLWTKGRGAVRIAPVADSAYLNNSHASRRARISRAYVETGSPAAREQAAFSVLLHRALAPESFVKAANLCGRRHPTRGWQWSINLTLETPPVPEHPATSTREFPAGLVIVSGARRAVCCYNTQVVVVMEIEPLDV